MGKFNLKTMNITRLVGVIFLVLALLFGVSGFLNQHPGRVTFSDVVEDFYANISSELFSIATTVLLIDYLNERRESQRRKELLIRELGSASNAITLRAVAELKSEGWLADGSLHAASLVEANLNSAVLNGASLVGAIFERAQLNKVDFREADQIGRASCRERV